MSKCRKISINETQYNVLNRTLLTESQESKSISAAKKLLQQRLGYDEKQADDFVRVKLRNDLPVLRTPEGGKFILGVTRMFLDGELRTANDINSLNSTLKLVASEAHINEYDRNLNGISSQDLISKFAKAMSDNMDAEKEEINNMTFGTPSDYNIVRIDSFDEAQEYSKFTSWCVTHYEDMFDSYTSDGINQFYFCLKNGFENERPIEGENCPLDKYGLSMIAVCVNENGMLNTCTCRWNHDNGGDDNIMTTKEISQVVGQNFYNVFLPNNKWKTIVDDALQRLANGESIYDVFDGVDYFYNGFARVMLNSKWNFINKEGSFISNQWFDDAYDFYNGLAKVELNGKCNLINIEGSLISNQWFDDVDRFYDEGIAAVKLNNKFNFINTEGSLISNQWFDDVYFFPDGLTKVELNNKYNFINTEGSLISNQWFDDVDRFYDEFAKVMLNGKEYKLDSNGRLYTLDLKPITLESVNMNKKVIITESQFQKLILESQESKSISQAVALVMQRMGYDKTKADNFVRGEIRASFPVLRDKNAGKFILGVTRMFLDGDIKDGQTINRLNSSIKLLSTDHYDEYDRNLNGLKANDVIERFATSLQANIDNDRQELANQTYNNTSEYQIVPIDSYEEASAFSPYVSWCVTKSPHAFNNYTNDGVGQFYFCLKHGWKTMQEEVGDGTPLDEYGLSMIAVCVDSDGALQSCTCRWNHANGGNDAIMTTKEISQVIGQNFYDVFKPNNRLQRLLDDIKMRLQDGAQYKDVFSVCQAFGEHSLVVQLKQPRKWAIFSEDGDLLSALYSDITSNLTKDIHDTIKTMIDSQGYYHLVDEYGKDYAQGNLINDCWFDRIKGKKYIHCKLGSYDDGENLYNLFDHRKKEWLFNKNVGKAEIHEDFPYIVIDNEMGKENLFEPETKTLVFDEWHDYIYPSLWFKTFFLVRDYLYNDGSDNRKENLYDLSKKSFVFDEWVDDIDWPNSYGDVKITKDHKCNLFDLYNGKYITDLWFDDMYLDVCVIVVGDDEKGYNILNNERTDVAYPIWFSRVRSDGYSRTSGLVQARYNGATWWINKSGQLYLWDEQRENFKQIPLENLLNYDNTGVQESVNMNKKVIVTESQFQKLILESQESKSISAAKKLLQQRMGYDEQQADDFVRVKLRNDLPVLRTPEGGKFILGVTRMFLDGELRTANNINNLNSTLKLVASNAHINEYDRNLNGMSSHDLISRFAKVMSDNMDAEKEEINSMTFEKPSDYNIIRIDSFEQAQEYGKFTSWCVTHDEDLFDSYTSDGISQFYFCLRNGFENERPIEGENCPLDKYGLSMIAVSVNENGMLNTCTCRWNHDNGGNDAIMTAKEISQVIGQNFYNVFLPNNKWKTIIDNALQRLANGEGINDVFDGVGEFSEGFARVELNNRCNFINTEGSFISNQWFDEVGNFNEGIAKVKLNGEYNAINTEGSFISNQWFDFIGIFYNGIACIELNDKWNFINTKGSLLSNQWFDYVDEFNDGFAAVELNDKYNIVNTEGSFISNQWFDWVGDFNGGVARVKLNDKYNIINTEGSLISNQWFDYVYLFYDGLAKVELNNKYNFINTKGSFISNQWFISAANFHDGFAKVGLNGKVYKLDSNGQLYTLDSQPITLESINMNKKVIITESQESKSISAAKKLLQQRLGYDEKQADDFVRVKLRNDLPVLRTLEGGKFILGVTRMFLDGELRTANNINNLNSTLKLVASEAHINEYDRNLNGVTSQDLISRFAKAMSDNMDAEKEEINNMTFEAPSDYNIIRIDSFEQAQEYGKFTSWCVTHHKNMFDSYTSDGINQFYFCLRNGFENEKSIKGENCPLDKYGLSMIAVCVNENGMLNTCTCRWNHDNGGNDNIMTPKEISQVIGQNFYNVFKANNIFNDAVLNVLERLKNGESINQVTNNSCHEYNENFTLICLKNKYNAINKNNELIFDTWFDAIGSSNEDKIVVYINDKANYIDTNGRILSRQWFDDCDPFMNGFAVVWQPNDTCNIIDANGDILFKQWFNRIGRFIGGFFKIELNMRHNYIDVNGEILSKQWFDHCENFSYGFGVVALNRKYNYIDTNGKILAKQWFDDCYDFSKHGFGRIKLGHQYYYIDKNEQYYIVNQNTGDLMPITLESVNMNKKVIITESQFQKLILESQESKSISQAVALVMQRMGYDKAKADNFVRGEIRASFPVLRDKNAGKFILGVTRMFLDGDIKDGQTINRLNSTIKLLSQAHYNEYDRNLNNMHAKDLIDRFAINLQNEIDNDKNELSSLTFNDNSNYRIVRINSFEEASQYRDYTSWCITSNRYMLDSYTNGGIGQFYFCLKNGFETVPKEKGIDAPLDEYGLSMIAVCVDDQGALQSCTCRWNHDNGGNDNIMNTAQISQVINRNFYEVFKPNVLEVVYEDEHWIIKLSPNEGCYLNIDKNDNSRYFFNFNEGEFIDDGKEKIEQPIIENVPMTSGAFAWYKDNVDQWKMLNRFELEFYVKDDVGVVFCKDSETDDWWLEDGSGNKIMENLRDVDTFIDQIWEEINSNGWSDIPCTAGGSMLLVLSNETRYINGRYRARHELDNLGGPYSDIECLTDQYGDEYMYKIFKCVKPDGRVIVKGQNDYHFNTFNASEINDIFMYGDVIFYEFEDGQYIIQNMDDDEFNTVQIPERFEGQLNYDEWPYMYWIYTDNGHEMKINMETFDYRYLHADNYDENEDF